MCEPVQPSKYRSAVCGQPRVRAVKRYQGSVGPEAIRGFLGALQLQGASRGVFLTTSTFTKQARESATKPRGTIVLVDGARLMDLMIEHGVGVTHETVKKPKVDGDYFEDA